MACYRRCKAQQIPDSARNRECISFPFVFLKHRCPSFLLTPARCEIVLPQPDSWYLPNSTYLQLLASPRYIYLPPVLWARRHQKTGSSQLTRRQNFPMCAFLDDPERQNICFVSLQNIILVFPLILAYCCFRWKILFYTYFSPLRHLPAAPQPFFLRRLLREPSSLTLVKWMDMVPNEGLIRYHGLFNAERLLLTNVSTAREVLQTKRYSGKKSSNARRPFEKLYADTAQLESFAGRGLVVVEGEEHSLQRAHTVSVLSKRNIENLHPLIWDKSQSLVRTLTSAIRPHRQSTTSSWKTIDISKWMTRLLLDLSSLIIFGHDPNCVGTPSTNGLLLKSYRSGFELSSSAKTRFLLLHVLPRSFVDLLPLSRNRDLANTRNAALAHGRPFIQSIVSTPPPKPLSILEHLSHISSCPTYLTTQATTILAGAHESTSSTLTAALWLLSQPEHSAIQSRLRNEIISSGHPLDSTKPPPVTALPYLNSVVSETLRLFAPFPIIGRRITTISGVCVNGVPLPKDTVLVPSPYALHRSTKLWGPDADDFKPERWLEDNGYSKDSFLAFGTGWRRCPGEKIARETLGMAIFGLIGGLEFAVPRGSKMKIQIGAQGSLRITGVEIEMRELQG